jgi:glycosyltransferase involved in cell wall biosynthesis
MKKILFIVNNRKDRSPGQRFRFEQYLFFLEQHGYQCDFSPLLNERDDKLFYSPGNYIQKLFILLKSYWLRFKNLRKASNYDIIFVFREALFTRSIYFEKQFAKRSKVIFDFDDSIWLQNVSDANKKFGFLKNADKTKEIIKIAHLNTVGNEYLAQYTRQFNNSIKIIPTTIDTDEYQLKSYNNNTNKIVIGWSGSVTTIQHFNYAIPALKKIKEKYGDLIEITVIGDGSYKNEALDIHGLPWIKATELNDLSKFDIGIMPLPDDEWAKGKCGLKALQYMALGIPSIISPVGVNSEIIQDGKNGFLASDENEWVDKISKLIESPELRHELGVNGRQTVVDKYSVEAWKDVYLETMNELSR